jgi:hypothetical protein
VIAAIALSSVAAVAGCGGGSVTVTPAGAVQDNFFVTWEIDSLAFGPIDCRTAGAATVDLDAVNVDSGRRFVFTFPCDAFQGQAGPIDVGNFDVLLNLTDPSGGVIDQVNVGTENVTQAGTIDLGHVVFRLQ